MAYRLSHLFLYYLGRAKIINPNYCNCPIPVYIFLSRKYSGWARPCLLDILRFADSCGKMWSAGGHLLVDVMISIGSLHWKKFGNITLGSCLSNIAHVLYKAQNFISFLEAFYLKKSLNMLTYGMEPYRSTICIRNILLLWIWNKVAKQQFLTLFTVLSAKPLSVSRKSSPRQGDRPCHVATNMLGSAWPPLYFFTVVTTSYTFSYANQKPSVH